MHCPACQTDNDTGAKFCSECGAKLAPACGSCGAELKEQAKFCSECGSSVAAVHAAETLPTRSVADYTPKHLAEKILQTRSALEGERKQVTVLFADVKGSMDLAGQLDPEEWHQILDRFFAILAEGVHRYEGTINQYTGDGIMALFGAPIAHEDHAQRACYAALHLRDDLRGYADQLRIERGFNFGVRFGLNSGEVVVGKIGDDLRMDYTAQGHTVGLAQRIEQLAESGRIYLSEHTQRLAAGYFKVRDLGVSKLKGVDGSVGIYELEGTGASRTRIDISKARGLTRFVGRDNEMSTLLAALGRAKEGHGQVVGVVGEPGLGKSRLCFEFVEHCRAEGVPVYEAHCPAHGRNVPFIPILELFRDYFGIKAQDSAAEARQKIAGILVLLDENLRDGLPVLFEFMGVADPGRPAPQVDADTRQRQLYALLHRIFRARNEQGISTVAFIDDLHWIDPGSDAFVAQMVVATEGSHNLFLVNFRPEYQADWTGRGHYQQLPLMPLSDADLRELVESLLGNDPSVHGLIERIMDWTAGNPFFTEEVVQTLVEKGHLDGTQGAYSLARDVDELEMPVNVQAVLAARIDRLPEMAKQALQTASVIGKEFPAGLLEAVAQLSAVDLAAAVDRLKANDFVFERSLYPEIEYAFKHPLTQEVAYNSQLQTRRSVTHAALAHALETREADNLDETAALLAYHWECASEPAEAVVWHERAGVWLGMTDGEGSLRHWQRIRELVRGLPAEAEILALGARACAHTIQLGWRFGISEADAEMGFEEGKALAERAGDTTVLAQLHGGYAAVRGVTFGDATTYLRDAREAVRLSEMVDNAELQCAMQPHLVWGLTCAGRPDEACEVAQQALGSMPDDNLFGAKYINASPRLAILVAYGNSLANLGRLREAKQILIDDDAEARSVERFQELAILAHYFISRLLILDGDLESAFVSARNALEDSEHLPPGLGPVNANLCMGGWRLANGDPAKAATFLEDALRIADESSAAGFLRGPAMGYLADAYLAQDKHEEAGRLAQEAVEFCRTRELRWDLQPWLALVRVRIAEHDEAAARAIIDETQNVIDATNSRLYQPALHECRAAFADAFGGEWNSGDELREALRLYLEMGATGPAERLADNQ